MMPYSRASSALMKKSRSMSFMIFLRFWPVCLARAAARLSLRRWISLNEISMSEAYPWAPPEGWWIMIRALGRANRLPLVPAASRWAPMLAAWPTQ